MAEVRDLSYVDGGGGGERTRGHHRRARLSERPHRRDDRVPLRQQHTQHVLEQRKLLAIQAATAAAAVANAAATASAADGAGGADGADGAARVEAVEDKESSSAEESLLEDAVRAWDGSRVGAGAWARA